MKYILLLLIIVSPSLVLCQKAFDPVYYLGKIGDSSISFLLSHGYPGGEQFIITTKSKKTVFNPCDGINNVGEIKMCHYDEVRQTYNLNNQITVKVDRDAQAIPDKVVIVFYDKRRIYLFRKK